MTVRRRTLRHLAHALAMNSVVATACVCDPLPPPQSGQNLPDPGAAGGSTAATPPPGAAIPTDAPPVVCDPMPAPYCPPDATSDEALSRISASAQWVDAKIGFSLAWSYMFAYQMSDAPTLTHGQIESPQDSGRGYSLLLVPDGSGKPMRLTFRLHCDGQAGTAAFDVATGAPGSDVKVSYVRGTQAP